jgi:predicted transcriptional regulator
MSGVLLQAQVLAVLRKRPMTTNEVTQELPISAVQAGNAINRLHRMGIVHSVGERLDPKSRRVSVWGLADYVYERYDCDRSGPTDGFTLPEFRWRTGQ